MPVEKTKMDRKKMSKEELRVSISADKITEVTQNVNLSVELGFYTPEEAIIAAKFFLHEIASYLDLVSKTAKRNMPPSSPEWYAEGVYNDFRETLIQILEEKYGLKIKICEHCEFFRGQYSPTRCLRSSKQQAESGSTCSFWALREARK